MRAGRHARAFALGVTSRVAPGGQRRGQDEDEKGCRQGNPLGSQRLLPCNALGSGVTGSGVTGSGVTGSGVTGSGVTGSGPAGGKMSHQCRHAPSAAILFVVIQVIQRPASNGTYPILVDSGGPSS